MNYNRSIHANVGWLSGDYIIWYQSMMRMESRVDGIEKEMTKMKRRVEEITNDMKKMSSHIEKMETNMETIKEFLQELRELAIGRDEGDKGKAPAGHKPSYLYQPLPGVPPVPSTTPFEEIAKGRET